MSSKLKQFSRKLLDGLKHLERPVFAERDLRVTDADSFALLRTVNVLVPVGSCESVDHDVHGSMSVTWIGECPFLFDPDQPSRDWIAIEQDDIRRFVFNHEAMMRWIASSNDMDGQSIAKGVVWTIGTKTINGIRCHVLYYPGTQDCDELLLALRDYDLGASEAKTPKLLITPAPLPLPEAELRRLDAMGIRVEHLYRLVGDNAIDLQRAGVSVSPSAKLYVFRRAGKNWEIGFETARPSIVPHKSGMTEMWLLLRNPGQEYTATAITNELNGLDESVAPARSIGTKARSVSDLTPRARAEFSQLMGELNAAKDDNDEFGRREAEEALAEWRKTWGISDSYQGLTARESDDVSKEKKSMARAVDRCIEALNSEDLAGLCKHLGTHIKTGRVFTYDPPEKPPWLTE